MCFELTCDDMLKSAYLEGARKGRPCRDVVAGLHLLSSLGLNDV